MRTPNLHRATIAQQRVRMEGWRQWRLSSNAKPTGKKKETDLTLTGLLMEGLEPNARQQERVDLSCAVANIQSEGNSGTVNRPCRSEPSRRWLLRVLSCLFELLNLPAKPNQHCFLNVRCVARFLESGHRISAFVQRDMVARERFASFLRRN